MSRLLSIDFLRGFVVLLMTIDHTRYPFSSVAISTPIGTEMPASYYFVRWITHFCAPTFALLAGLSIALRPLPSIGDTNNEMQLTLIKRGLFLIMMEISTSIVFNLFYPDTGFVYYLAALWAIGGGMIFVALMMKFKPWIIAAVSIALVAGHNYLGIFDGSDSVLWSFLHVTKNHALIDNQLSIMPVYPLMPWLGIAGLGYVMGLYFFSPRAALEKKRKPMLLGLGAVCILLFSVLRFTNWYGDPNLFVFSPDSLIKTLYSFIDVSKYPPSLLFILITMPLSCFVPAFTDSKFFKQPNMIVTVISQYGQAALFYYILHMYLIIFYGYLLSHIFHDGGLMSGKSDSLALTMIMTIVVIVTAYPIVRLFTRFRHKHKAAFPILAYF